MTDATVIDVSNIIETQKRGGLPRHVCRLDPLGHGSAMRIFAVALGVSETFFADNIDHHPSALRLTYYPAQAVPPLPGQIRGGEHTHYGSLAILRGDVPGGLQVQRRDGVWQDVHPVPGSFVCNIGDLMMR